MSGDTFVYTLMLLNAGASVAYLWHGQYIKSLYWVAALLLNFCVLRMR